MSVVAVLTERAGMSEIVVSGEYNHYILIYVSSGMKSNTSDRIRCNWPLLSDLARENSQSKTPKPKLTFVIVGKRFIGCTGSHRVDGKYLGIIFIFSRWMECSSVSFMFDLFVRLMDYFFRGADGTGNGWLGRSKSYYSWLLSTIQSCGGLRGSELSDDVFGCSSTLFFSYYYTVLGNDSFGAIPCVSVSRLFLALVFDSMSGWRLPTLSEYLDSIRLIRWYHADNIQWYVRLTITYMEWIFGQHPPNPMVQCR